MSNANPPQTSPGSPRRQFLKTAGAAGLIAATTPHRFVVAANQTNRANWWGWRGPNGNNIAPAGSSTPDNPAKSIRWECPIPGRGHCSPIVVGDLVVVSTADKPAGTQSVIAVDRTKGKIAWNRVVHESGIPAENHGNNTEASPTMAFDGNRLFVSFYNDNAVRLSTLDLSGNLGGTKMAGAYNPQQFKYGYAASPVIDQKNGTVVVVGDYDGSPFLTAIDRKNGRSRWTVKRPVTISFSTPALADVGSKQRLLLSGAGRVVSYDAATGRVDWETKCTTMATCGTMVWNNELVFASGGYPKRETVALNARTGSIVWQNRVRCYEQSMVCSGDHLYAMDDSGIAYCWDAASGDERWKQRLGGPVSSSPVLIGNTIHVCNERGTHFA
ncbi:MAG: PQQ-binding-like beta-propeller repeat protein, partial [Planctomycetota bacterium]